MFEQIFKNIDDFIWKDAGCDSELDYAEQTSWILFLKWLDDFEQDKEIKAKLDNKNFKSIFDKDYKWSSWAAVKTKEGKVFNCRPRGTREDRMELYKNGKKYIGKKLTICFQELTDDKVPRFPVGIAFRDYE